MSGLNWVGAGEVGYVEYFWGYLVGKCDCCDGADLRSCSMTVQVRDTQLWRVDESVWLVHIHGVDILQLNCGMMVVMQVS